jgi:hypothetical protein
VLDLRDPPFGAAARSMTGEMISAQNRGYCALMSRLGSVLACSSQAWRRPSTPVWGKTPAATTRSWLMKRWLTPVPLRLARPMALVLSAQ